MMCARPVPCPFSIGGPARMKSVARPRGARSGAAQDEHRGPERSRTAVSYRVVGRRWDSLANTATSPLGCEERLVEPTRYRRNCYVARAAVTRATAALSWASEIGLLRITSPGLVARVGSGGVMSAPDTITIGTLGDWLRATRTTSQPLTPGMRMSVTMRV